MSQHLDNLPIAQWISSGQNQNATHLIVVYDAGQRSYKPVYVKVGQNLEQKRREYETGSYTVLTDYILS
jgi:hypothetical protein